MGPGDFTPDQKRDSEDLESLDVEALNNLAKTAYENYKAAANEHTNYRLYDQKNPPANDSEKQDRKDKLAALKRAEDRANQEWGDQETLAEEARRKE